MRNRDKTKTCSKVDSVQVSVCASGLVHSDRRVACIRWREKAQVVEKHGCHGPIDSRPFRSVLPRCATETRLSHVPKLIQSKAMYEPMILRTLIGGMRAYGGVGRLKSFKKQGFHRPMDSRPFRAFRPRCATETRLKPGPQLVQSKATHTP